MRKEKILLQKRSRFPPKDMVYLLQNLLVTESHPDMVYLPPKGIVYLLQSLLVIKSHPKTWFICYIISSLLIPTQRHGLLATKSPRYRFPPKDIVYLLQNLLVIDSHPKTWFICYKISSLSNLVNLKQNCSQKFLYKWCQKHKMFQHEW